MSTGEACPHCNGWVDGTGTPTHHPWCRVVRTGEDTGSHTEADAAAFERWRGEDG